MNEKRILAYMVLVVLSAGASAQVDDFEPLHTADLDQAVAAASPNCSAGVVYDDGSFTDGYSLGDGDPGDATMVMKLDLPAGSTGLDQVCVCFSRSSTGPTSMPFQIVVYNDNGGGGVPGTLLGTVNATATGLTTGPAFYGVSLIGSGISLPDTGVYVGARFPGGPDFFLCGDRSGTTPQRTNFGSGNQGASWTNMGTLFPAAPPRALGIRADSIFGASSCVPSATAMCLNNNRFRVEASFRTASSPSPSPAQVVKLTDDTGYFWFFASTNVEVVVKVLNACTFPGSPRYWVFAAGLTNVEVILRVTDTQTGIQKSYINPLNQPFPPLQDTGAFATCP
ncbi:MAG TPA: hypothetical protein VFR31_21645 [Thermoanaerobaculia bacterium]|nr:hypothetical protein [Thermoanaerobaculia bacterium]